MPALSIRSRFPRVPVGVVFALGFLATIACKNNDNDIDDEDDNEFREDVITCEDAVARLVACCPGFDATPVLCNYYWHHVKNTGCGSTTESYDSKTPALTIAEAKCIEATSCDQLQSKGVCARAQNAREGTYNSSVTTDDDTDASSFVSPVTSSRIDASAPRSQAVCQ